MNKLYVIDTSSLARLRPDNDSSEYDVLIFPGIIEALQILIDEQRLFSSLLVYDELEDFGSVDDKLMKWITINKDIFLPPTSTIQRNARMLISRFPHWIEVEKKKNDADAFVVATAMELKASIVTEETEILMQPNTKKVKIPNVCKQLNLECSNILSVFRNENYKFIMAKE